MRRLAVSSCLIGYLLKCCLVNTQMKSLLLFVTRLNLLFFPLPLVTLLKLKVRHESP
ncbi:unnamed protein product [Phytomonas sp. Hart1]|nr:unnamed protein product [Phytomonas sp. Hart1]|eukprot:CCW70917.1 unnamed protein product [Phytomonas sp. isolate Hart1]